jgi:hypothetical protein
MKVGSAIGMINTETCTVVSGTGMSSGIDRECADDAESLVPKTMKGHLVHLRVSSSGDNTENPKNEDWPTRYLEIKYNVCVYGHQKSKV